MKYRIVALILSILLLLSLASCSGRDETTTANNTTTTNNSTTTTPLNNVPLPPADTRYTYSNMSEYITLPNYKDHTITVSNELVDGIIKNSILESATHLYEAKRGDDIYVNLKFAEIIYIDANETIPLKGNAIQSISKENFYIEGLGEGAYNKELEELIISWNIRITMKAENTVTLPNDSMFGEYAGKKVYLTCEFVDKVCENGDIVSVNYTGYYTDGNGNIRLNELGEKDFFDYGTDVKFHLGSGTAIEDFENGIIGMRLGEGNKREIHATFPDDYSEALGGQKVIFEVSVKEIYICPEYNDDFAKSVGYDTVELFEEDIINQFANDQIYYWLMENTVFIKYPEKEYNELLAEIERLNSIYEENYGMTYESYISIYYGMTKNEYIEWIMKEEMLYYAIARANGIIPTDAQISEADSYEDALFDLVDAHIGESFNVSVTE